MGAEIRYQISRIRDRPAEAIVRFIEGDTKLVTLPEFATDPLDFPPYMAFVADGLVRIPSSYFTGIRGVEIEEVRGNTAWRIRYDSPMSLRQVLNILNTVIARDIRTAITR